MTQDDIELARELIANASKETPYGPALSTPYALLKTAIDHIEGGGFGAVGVSRDPDNSKVLMLSFRAVPTDDAIRKIHDLLR